MSEEFDAADIAMAIDNAERCGGKPGLPKSREEENDYRGPWHTRNDVCAVAPLCHSCPGCEDCAAKCPVCGCFLAAGIHTCPDPAPRFTTAELVEAVRRAKHVVHSKDGLCLWCANLESAARHLEWIAEAEKGLVEMATTHPQCEFCGEIATNLLAKLREI